MKFKSHIIRSVKPGSIAEEVGIEPGDALLTINSNPINDVLDYMYLTNTEYLEMAIRKKDGQQWVIEIEKDVDEELGLDFQNPIMDREKHCANNCIFCFIDQLPPNTRPTMHIKDDDWRLSFLAGNYVTLTNISEKDINRIIKRRFSPIYISVHTTNLELRKKMIRNEKADNILDIIERFHKAGIYMHCQIVLCKGWNDGVELDRTISDLWKFRDTVQSVAVVPVGLTGYRQGLEDITPFNCQTAGEVVEQIEKWQQKFKKEENRNFVFAADEFYILSRKMIPPYESYEDFPQIENGVGLVAKFNKEFWDALNELGTSNFSDTTDPLSIVTGESAYEIIQNMANVIMEKTGKQINVYSINNNFFGGYVTVAGLVTGRDIIDQLKGKELGNKLLIPKVMIREDQDVFLDDVSVNMVERELKVPVIVVPVDGGALVEKIMREG